jgi:hypothetical protein
MQRLFRSFVLTALLVAAFLAPPARAQMGALRAMAGGMTTPNVNQRQMKLYAKVLGLSADQTKAAEDLLSSYETEYLAAIKRFQEIQQAANQEFMQSGDMQDVQGAVQDAIKKFHKRAETLEQTLMTDLKSLLEPAQLEQWPRLERLHRRMTTVNWGSLSGESVDLFDLVEGLRLDTERAAPVQPVLARYEVDLDHDLQARNALVQEQLRDWFDSGFTDFSEERLNRMKKQMADLREAGSKVVELNKRYADQIRPLLPEEAQAEFSQKVKLASFPIVYRKSYPERVLEAALKFTDLDAQQREGLTTLRDSYARDAAALNDRWAAAIADHELHPSDENPFAAFMPNRNVPEDIKKAKEARDAIDDRTVDAAKALLTDAQKARLPNKKDRPDLDFDAIPREK